METTKFFYILIALFLLCACGPSKERKAELEENYQETSSKVEKINRLLDDENRVLTDKEIEELTDEVALLGFSYDDDDVSDDETHARYAALNQKVKDIKEKMEHLWDNGTRKALLTKVNVDGKLLETQRSYPVYLKRGEELVVDIDMEKPSTIQLYNADSKTLFESERKGTAMHNTFNAPFTAIYLVSVIPWTPSYANISLKVKTGDRESIESPAEIKTSTETVGKGDALAHKVDGIKMKNMFEEPKKFTLRGQLKAASSGSYRALVPLQVPAGATDIMYSLRISTNETPAESDGEFKQNMDVSYHKVRLMGLPLYESSRGSGLLSTILGENVPPREEDAYINMYVFMNAKDARKFQNNQPADKLKYHLDYSQMGTQSCDGRIPCAGRTTIYLGFENERMRYNNYVWLEAVSSTPKTEYVREKYSIASK